MHAVRYKQAIDAYIRERRYDDGARPLRSLVAFSGPLELNGVTYTEALMNGFGEPELPRRFGAIGGASEGGEFGLLVVAEKYQTGFDQPLLHTMYVDKKLAGVKAVQTPSRLNRTAPGKVDTFVLDFANTVEEIQDAFAPFFEATSALVADPNDVYNLQLRVMEARVLDETEMDTAVMALLSGVRTTQARVYASLGLAVDRFKALDAEEQESFRAVLTAYVRAYAFLAQVMTWTDRELERLYLFGKALLAVLPRGEDDPVPPVSDQVDLTHLRISATVEDDNASLTEGSDEAGVVLPGGGVGREAEAPVDRLSILVERLNERFGIGTTEADKLWFEQQRLDVVDDAELRTVAKNNDRDAFVLYLSDKVRSHVARRHGENTKMFDLFFNDSRFSRVVIEYLAETYDELRGGVGA